MIDIGVASSMTGIDSIDELLPWAKSVGCDCLELMGGHLDWVMNHDEAHVKRVFNQHNIRISSLAPMLNLLDPDDAIRQERVATLSRIIEAAPVLDVDVVVTYGGSAFGMFFWGLPSVGPNHPSNRVEENLQIWAQVYSPLADLAEKHGVRIAFETAPRGGGHGNVAHCPELWDRMFELLPSPALGLSFDPSHLVWLMVPVEETIQRYAPRIYHMDGKDTEIFPERLHRQGVLGNDWWQYRIPGNGQLDWKSIWQSLEKSKFKGSIDVENEDRLLPGKHGCEQAVRHLREISSR